MDSLAETAQPRLLGRAEPLLLVDDHQSEIRERDALGRDRMGADHDAQAAVGEAGPDAVGLGRRGLAHGWRRHGALALEDPRQVQTEVNDAPILPGQPSEVAAGAVDRRVFQGDGQHDQHADPMFAPAPHGGLVVVALGVRQVLRRGGRHPCGVLRRDA